MTKERIVLLNNEADKFVKELMYHHGYNYKNEEDIFEFRKKNEVVIFVSDAKKFSKTETQVIYDRIKSYQLFKDIIVMYLNIPLTVLTKEEVSYYTARFNESLEEMAE